jgi:hypothetical protein
MSYIVIQVTEEKLLDVLTTRKQITRGEQFIVPYKYQEVGNMYFMDAVGILIIDIAKG